MNLESLRQRILGATTAVTLSDGTTIRLGKLSAQDGMALAMPAKKLEHEPEGSQSEDMLTFYALILSKSILDDAGAKALDSDEGRAMLRQLPMGDFLQLGNAAVEWQFGESKKNSLTTNSSPTISAASLESSTLIICSPVSLTNNSPDGSGPTVNALGEITGLT